MTTPTTPYYALVPSPVGELLVVGEGGAVTAVKFHGTHRRGLVVDERWAHDPDRLSDAADQLAAYFAGRLRTFDLPLAPRGTPFQRQVWDALTTIPYGETTSYGELADRLGRPGSARAVGAANGANPIAIVVPCHRVVGSDRSLTGYAGGLGAKRHLLALESALPVPNGAPDRLTEHA
jgi:methylated-DNA-[protein]-cysteine S-methyltransferase